MSATRVCEAATIGATTAGIGASPITSAGYRWNQPSIGNVGAGIFGFIAGAAIANSFNNSNDNGWNGNGSYNSHVARCEARFRSYNARTDMYLGFDGDYHRCNL